MCFRWRCNRRMRASYDKAEHLHHRLPGTAFDEAYAVARVTPGTNLLAMYTLLGERFARWPGALLALSVGALVPAIVAVTLGAAYVEYADHPLAREAMQGARAGALAVFAWAVFHADIAHLGAPSLNTISCAGSRRKIRNGTACRYIGARNGHLPLARARLQRISSMV
jgi:hypothetical protein